MVGELINDNRRETKVAMLDKMPSLKAMYSADNDNTKVMYLRTHLPPSLPSPLLRKRSAFDNNKLVPKLKILSSSTVASKYGGLESHSAGLCR